MTEFVYDEIAEEMLDFFSNAIERIAYDRENRSLFVEFQTGGEYVYNGVEESTFNLFRTAPSLGRFFQNHIEGEYGGGVKDEYDLISRDDTDDFADEEDRPYDYQPRRKWLTSDGDTPNLLDDGGVVADGTTIVSDSLTANSILVPTRYGVKWVSDNGVSGEPEFYALSEADALAQFEEALKAANTLGFAVTPKVKAVTHYLD